MELIVFITSVILVSNQYYYLFILFLTSLTVFEWTIENDDKIFEDKFALVVKNTCLSINRYNNKICKLSVYNYLNNKFLVFISIVKKSVSNKIKKIYYTIIFNNFQNNYDKILMSCLGNINNFIEPSFKNKEKKINNNNIDEQIKKYISTFKKTE
jgi:hypothetical protein